MTLRSVRTNLLASAAWGLVFSFVTLTTQAQVNPSLSGAARAPLTAGLTPSSGFGLQDVSRRVEELEMEGSQRNGTVERMQFAIEAIARRVDEIQKDYDLRLNSLEQRLQVLEQRAPGPVAAPMAAAPLVGGSPTVAIPAGVSLTIPATMTPTDLYNRAYAYLTATQYATAEAWLVEFLRRHPADALADNAHYWLGETRMVQNNPAGAVQAFRDGLRAFPQGAKAPDNLLKMGMALELLKQPQLAKAAWDKLVKDFPNSAQTERAKARLAGLKL